MLKAITTSTATVSANGTVPITLKYNTNGNTSLSNNIITINRSGIYNINAVLNVTATATTTNIGLYANGTLIPETNTTITSVVGDEYQLVINDIERVIRSLPVTQNVQLTIQTTTGATIDIANVSLVEIR